MNKCCTHLPAAITSLNGTVAAPALQQARSRRSMSNHINCPSHQTAPPGNPSPFGAAAGGLQLRREQIAFEFFARTLQLYSIDQLMVCFNGGKDCTVLLDLLMRYCRQHNISSRAIPVLYIKSDDAFAEIDEFVAFCVQHYDFQLIEYEESLKEALTHMTADMPRIKAVFMGSRNTDPYCQHLAPMEPTDNGWPPMMRLSPLLEWSYHDVWSYIRLYDVPYCLLYKQGYTSIGYKSNTVPNPHLRCSNNSRCTDNNRACSCVAVGNEGERFRPAWELADVTQERAGRLVRK